MGLLVAVLLRLDIIDGSHDESPAERGRLRLATIAVVSLAMTLGELVSLLVLFHGQGSGLAHAVVGVTALLAVAGLAPPAMLTVLRQALGRDLVNQWLRRAAWGLVAALGVGAIVASIVTAESSPSASLNTPRFYHVYGTCAAGACGLNERVAPTPQSKKIGQLQDGTTIGVICQTYGYPLRADGRASRIWDQLANASYVSDLFVSTPHVGTFSPELKRCPTKAITNGTQG